ncbi:hypothetical protein BJV77DRAFT_989920 [Russula vinacea]|nr:hypothetical protein BJV77DRAFT_989920 [Russula vinacea]
MTGTSESSFPSQSPILILPLRILHEPIIGVAPEIGGMVPSEVPAWRPTPSSSVSSPVPSTIQGVLPSMAPDLSPGCPAYGINNTMGDSDQRIWNAYLHAGSDVITQVSATHPALNPYEDSQKSSPAAVQTWPLVAGAQGSAPMDLEASPQGSGVERQPPIPRDYTEALNFGGDFANPSADPTAPGASREKCGDEWTGTLYWNLNAVCARTQAPVRNSML